MSYSTLPDLILRITNPIPSQHVINMKSIKCFTFYLYIQSSCSKHREDLTDMWFTTCVYVGEESVQWLKLDKKEGRLSKGKGYIIKLN